MIGTYEDRDGVTVEVHCIKGKYTVFAGERMVQQDLSPDDFVRYACWALQSAHYLLKAKK